MKKSFNDFVEELKNGLNDFITPETSKETVDKIASFSSVIDNITAEYQSVKRLLTSSSLPSTVSPSVLLVTFAFVILVV